MKKTMVNTLFLDFYGTLVHEDNNVIDRICRRIKDESPYGPEINDRLNRRRRVNPGDIKADMECTSLIDVLDNLGMA